MKTLLLAVLLQCPDGTPPPCAGRATPRPAPPAANSVAVLYFDNESRDTGDVYLADGLTEEIITRLTGIERLTVRSRHVVRRYRGTALGDPSAVARALNVSYLVTGSVRRSGARIRVNAELIRGATGAQVWAHPCDQGGTDAIAIQETVARDVATGIVGRLLPAERGAIAAQVTRSPAAYDHFLRGNYLLGTRGAQSMLLAVREYEAAAAADPTFADAVARIGYTWATLVDNEFDVGLTRDTLVARGVASAERAVAMDSMSSDAWLALAYIREAQNPRTLAGAGPAFVRALALNPRSAEAHHQYADFLSRGGDSAGARVENRRALELEPGRAATYTQLMNMSWVAGRIREALQFSDSLLAFNPGSEAARRWRVLHFAALGDSAGLDRAIEDMRLEPDPARRELMARFSAARSRDPAAMARLREYVRSRERAEPGTQLRGPFTAALLVFLGDRQAAIEALEASRPRGAVLNWLIHAPAFDPIRADPRFQRVFTESQPPPVR